MLKPDKIFLILNMSRPNNSVYIKATIARLYIVLGILFVLIFTLGFLILKDYTNIIYALSSTFLIVIGFVSLKSPYADFSKNELIIYNFIGKIRIKYTFSDKKEVKVKNNKLYLNGEKMKISHSFVNTEEWKRLINFYSDDSQLLEELQD